MLGNVLRQIKSVFSLFSMPEKVVISEHYKQTEYPFLFHKSF